MRLNIPLMLVILLIAGVIACTSDSETNGETNEDDGVIEETGEPVELEFEGEELSLSKIVIDGEEVPIIRDAELTIRFSRGKVNGFTGCKGFIGKYRAGRNATLSITEVQHSKQICSGLMGQEQRFLEILKNARSYEFSEGTLVISSNTGSLRFIPKI